MSPTSKKVNMGKNPPGPEKGEPLPHQPEGNLIRAARLDLLFKNLPIGLAVNVLNSLLAVVLFWGVVSRPGLIAWFSTLILITLYRLSLFLQFQKRNGPRDDPRYWEIRYTIGSGLAGVTWGGVVFLLFQGESIIYQVFASFVLGGMVLGSVAINSVLPKAFILFTVPAVVPIMVRFFMAGETVYTLMGIITLVFFGAMVGAGFQFRSIFDRSLGLGIEKKEMVRRLLLEKERTNKLSVELADQTWKDRQIQDAVRFIAEKTLGETGQGFFDSLSKHLATAFRVKYSFLMKLDPVDKGRGNVFSLWNGSGFEAPFECLIKETPFGGIFDGKVVHIPSGVHRFFEGRNRFGSVDSEGYLGFPLTDTEGRIVGQIGLMHHRPLPKNETHLSVLKLFSIRAAVELQRQQFDEDLRVFKALIDRANDAILIIDPDTPRFVDVNQKAVSSLGYSRGELLRMSVFDISKGFKNKEDWKAHLRKLKEAGFMTLEDTHRRKDGSVFPVETSASHIPIGKKEFVVAVVRDITERRRAEAALKRANRQKELILENSEEGIYGLDSKGRTTFINQAGARLLGWTPEELLGKNQHVMVHHSRLDGSTYPVAQCPIHAVLKDGSVHHVRDEVFWCKDGTSFPVEYTSSPILEEGHVIGAVVVYRNVTERKATEKARFREILEAAPDGVVGVDSGGIINLVNTQTERLFGFSREELVGQSVEMLLPDRFMGTHPGNGKKFFNDPGTRAMVARELVGRRKDGSEFPVDVSLSILNTEEGSLALSTVRDVTERKKLDAAIQNTASELQLTFDSIDAFMVVTDMEGRVIRNNTRAETYWGLSREEILGRYCGELREGKACAEMGNLVEKVRETRKPQAVQVREENGRIWDLSANLSGDSWKGESRIILVGRDVTEQVRLQERLHQTERLTALGELVSGVSHEVRNPLFSISATLDAFEARFGKKEEFGRYLKIFRGATQRLLELMKDLLEYARPVSMEPAFHSFSGIIEKAVRDCEAVSSGKNVKVVSKGPGPEIIFKMDYSRMVQVFQNLVENAVQYTPEGGNVVIESRIIKRDSGDWVESRVMDSGEGFRPGEFSNIFEPFYTHRRGGTGLGLAIVRRLVEEHGGFVEAENDPHGGGVVTVTLPLSFPDEEKEKKGE